MSEARSYIEEIAEHGYREADEPLFLSLWERLEDAYFARLDEVSAAAQDWRECFRACAQETARLVEEYGPQAHFLVVDALSAGALGRERRRAFGRRLAQRLDRAREELSDPEAIPASTAPWIVSMFFDRIYRRCTIDGGPDLSSQLPELTFLAISAYFGAEAGLRELIPPP